MDDLLACLNREAVHHLDGRGGDAGGDDPRHRLAGVAHGGERRQDGLGGLRDSDDAEHDLGHDAERPLAADHHAEEVVAPGVANLPSEPSDPPVSGDERCPEDVVRGEAVFQAVRPAGVLGDVAADRAHLLRRRIGCVEVAERPHRLADIEIGDPRLHRDLVVVEVDVEDRSHPAEADDHAVRNREGSTGQPRSRAARDERHLSLGACPDDLGHLRGGERQHDRGRRDAPPGEPVACVGLQRRRRGDHPVIADDVSQPLEQGAIKHVRPAPPPRHRSCVPPRFRWPCPYGRCARLVPTRDRAPRDHHPAFRHPGAQRGVVRSVGEREDAQGGRQRRGVGERYEPELAHAITNHRRHPAMPLVSLRQPLRKDVVEGGLEGAQEGHRVRREVFPRVVDRGIPTAEVGVVRANVAQRIAAAAGSRRDREQREAGRNAQCLLRAGEQDVDIPACPSPPRSHRLRTRRRAR